MDTHCWLTFYPCAARENSVSDSKLPFKWIAAEVGDLKISAQFNLLWNDSELCSGNQTA